MTTQTMMSKSSNSSSNKSNINIITISMETERLIMVQLEITQQRELTTARKGRMAQQLRVKVMEHRRATEPLPETQLLLAMVLPATALLVMNQQGTTQSVKRRSASTRLKLLRRTRQQR